MHAFSFALGTLPAWFLPFAQITLFSAFTVYVYRAPTKRSAFLRGWVFSFSFLLTGIHWLYNSMHVYGHMPAFLAISAVALFAAFLALLPALSCLLFALLRQRAALSHQLSHLLLLSTIWASCWTLGEWIRGIIFTGFPWLNIAYAHIDSPLAGWIPVVGAYGLAWIAAFGSAAIATLVIYKDQLQPEASFTSLGVALALVLIGIVLNQVAWSRPDGAPFIARLVQGNIPQAEKFDPDTMLEGIQRYRELTALAPKEPEAAPSLIVLPETVLPMFQDSFDPIFWQEWIALAQQLKADLLLGVPLIRQTETGSTYTNSVILIDSNTQAEDIIQAQIPAYHKHHLVPFGEFVPVGFKWFVDMLQIPLGNFQRGPLPQGSFTLQSAQVAPNICYEDVFGNEIRQSVLPNGTSPGANVLVNVSNLAWFASAQALYQHLQFSRMRAVETARPMLRATNTGITAVIDARGQVRASLAPMVTGVLDAEVQGRAGLTPYVRWGDTPALMLIGIWLALALGLGLRRNVRTGA
ncbi:apolipoprotein N-acyltransferase [Alcaligenes endophyticus]|uniref:Apolipoprotein N-acyltransferase n=1 Tax=Alcaligenes endophyticus TaxID=1929088 RepID=A0ABT8EGW1_9BURK|nr:apolipoprotein N-acyltransferase [Alcaligenes endophyticus]MCX5589819.1 apolipoprotein N-acyltransferase [Alcaligenes endophyticus]MDN4120518.1 apolipoprotein N-acyltransferase [Alcaligenes endophyticus]